MNAFRTLCAKAFWYLIVTLSCGKAFAIDGGLQTRSGHEFAASVSSYLYEEPSLRMSTKGDKMGITHIGTATLERDWFVKGESRIVLGSVDYTGSGFQAGVPDWYVEVRGLLGKDIPSGGGIFSPYVGFGYRYLFNDLRGYSSSGAIGYRRESNYFYIPLGITHRFDLGDSARLATTLEFDRFVSGEQVSKLSDLVGHGGYTVASDISNSQNEGWGFRADVMYEMADWSFGPFLILWQIGTSDSVLKSLTQHGVTKWYIFTEPANRTNEYGLSLRTRF